MSIFCAAAGIEMFFGFQMTYSAVIVAVYALIHSTPLGYPPSPFEHSGICLAALPLSFQAVTRKGRQQLPPQTC
jgi:hypothetical protein